MGIGYLTNERNCFAKKKKKNVNEMAIKKCTNNPTRASSAGLEKVFGSTAPLATYLNTCIGEVPPFIYALIQAPIISNDPATRPAVSTLAKNDFLIKEFWFTIR
jgi:hypothetical protein